MMNDDSGPRARDDMGIDSRVKAGAGRPKRRRGALLLLLPAATLAVAGLVWMFFLSADRRGPELGPDSNGGNSGAPVHGESAEVVSEPDSPAGFVVQALSESSVGLSWRPRQDSSSVSIERKEGGGAYQRIATVSSDFSYRDDDLAPSSTYSYRITVEGLDGRKVHSEEVSALTLPAAPSPSSPTSPSPAEIDVAWGQLDQAVSRVRVERRSGPEDFALIAVTPSADRSYHDTGLYPNTTYMYRLQAVNSSGASAYSGQVEGVTLPEPPLDLEASALNDSQVQLSWFNPEGTPIRIEVERQRGPGGALSVIKTEPGQGGLVDQGLTPNTAYLYRVRALNDAGFSDYSEPVPALTLPEAPGRLTVQSDSPTTLGLTWQAPHSPPAAVVVERSDGFSPFTEIVRLKPGNTRHADGGLQPNTTYSYRVFASNESGSSRMSELAEGTTLPVAPTEVAAYPRSPGEIEIHWSYPEEVDGFRVERQGAGDATPRRIPLDGSAGTSLVDRAVAANTSYRYRVQAFNRSGGSDYSDWVETLTTPSAPSLIEALAVSPHQVQLTWRHGDGPPAAVRVERRERGGDFEEMDWVDPGFDQYVDAAVLDDRVYEYRVVAANDSGVSEFSNPIRVVTPPLPFPARVQLKKDRVVAGESVDAVVTLSAPAPPAGWVLRLDSSDPEVAETPSHLEFGAGEQRKTFAVGTSAQVRDMATVRVSVESDGRVVFADLTVEPLPPPDPAADRIEFRVLRTGGNGKILVRGVVRNVGRGSYRSERNQQAMKLYEVVGGRAKLIGQASFQGLEPGGESWLQAERPFDFGPATDGDDESTGTAGRGRRGSSVSAAPSVSHPPDSPERRVPPQYRLVIEYSPSIGNDGNPWNDDANLGNNELVRSGSDIVRSWRNVSPNEPF